MDAGQKQRFLAFLQRSFELYGVNELLPEDYVLKKDTGTTPEPFNQFIQLAPVLARQNSKVQNLLFACAHHFYSIERKTNPDTVKNLIGLLENVILKLQQFLEKIQNIGHENAAVDFYTLCAYVTIASQLSEEEVHLYLKKNKVTKDGEESPQTSLS